MHLKLLVLLLPLAVTAQLINFEKERGGFRQLERDYKEGDGLANEQGSVPIDSQAIESREFNNEYLPPVSSTPPPIIRIASEPPQDENALINEDSRINNYLAPPFNDIDRSKESVPRPNVVLINNVKPLPASQFITEPKRPQNNFLVVNQAEPTSESRNYLPPQPEYSAAAQTPQVQVVAAAPKENEHHHHGHHHHHHHHHDENFDICSDAFHSFLCTPLKPRRRITGAFPEGLRGQASFNDYQKVLPDRTPAPSNEFLNQYLPPVNNQYLPPVNNVPERFSVPSNIIESTTFLPVTTQPPRTFATTTFSPRTTQTLRTVPTTTFAYPSSPVIADTSNVDDRYYLPPVPGKKKNDFFLKSPEHINAVENAIKLQPPFPSPSAFGNLKTTTLNNINSVFPTSVSTQKPFVSTVRTTQRFSPSSSFQTTKKAFPQAGSTFLPQPSNGVTYYSTQKVNSPFPTSLPGPKSTFQGSTFNSPQPTGASTYSSLVPARRVTDYRPKTFATAINNLLSPSSNDLNGSSRGRIGIQSSFAPQPPTPSIQQSNNFISTTTKPFTESSTFRTSERGFDRVASPLAPTNSELDSTIRASSNVISTTVKSFDSERKDLTPKHHLQLDNTFLPPLPSANEQPDSSSLPNNDEDRKNLCNDPFNSFLCANLNSGKLDSAPQQTVKVSEPQPVPTTHSTAITMDHNTPETPKNLVPQPSIVSPVVSNNDGYRYSPPDNVFPLSSEQTVTISTSTPKVITTKKYEPPTTLAVSPANTFIGYAYPSPEPGFPLPSEIIQTADTGYIYSKPDKEFPEPAAQNVVAEAVAVPTTSSPSTTPRPSPTTLHPTTLHPSPTTLRPTTLRPSPTTLRPTTLRPPPTTPTPSPSTFASSTALPATTDKGYIYPKPQPSFEISQKQGYTYPKPENPLELPNERELYQSLFSEVSTASPIDDLGSALFIPVNKLDKRSDSTRTRRFGERLKKLERKTF